MPRLGRIGALASRFRAGKQEEGPPAPGDVQASEVVDISFSERISNFFGDFVPNLMEFFSRMRQPPSKVIAGHQLKAGREGKREIRRELQVRPEDRESVRLLVDAFNLYDRDNSGSICRDELRDVLRATGKNPTEDEINDLMTRVDLDGSGDLDVDEFVALMMESSGFSASANRPFEDLRPVFHLLLAHPASSPATAKVSAVSIREMMSGPLMPDGGAEDAADVTEGLRDGDLLGFDQFVRMVSGAEKKID